MDPVESSASLCISQGMENYLRRLPPVQETVRFFNENPDELDRRVAEFDIALNSLSVILRRPSLGKDPPHMAQLSDTLGEYRVFPALSILAYAKDQGTRMVPVEKAWQTVRQKVKTGEWHPDEAGDPARFGSTLLVAGYATLLTHLWDDEHLDDIFPLAFEEYLRDYAPDSQLARDLLPQPKG